MGSCLQWRNFRSFWDRVVAPSTSATHGKCTKVYHARQGGVRCLSARRPIWFEALLQLSRSSVFADMAAITVQIAGDASRFGKDAKRIVRDAWKKVGL